MTRNEILPTDPDAVLVGRVFDPALGGPCVVHLRGDTFVDVTHSFPTLSDLLDTPDPAAAVAAVAAHLGYPVDAVLQASAARDPSRPHLLAPCDLQAIKACGVTFVRSMLERVIEERAGGDLSRAAAIRERVAAVVGGRLSEVRPGSVEAAAAKRTLQEEGLWSQYLEVGIGPDAEVFTKAPVLSAVGQGAMVGVLGRSHWNNPEPEVVLAVDWSGQVKGATLGNDVNLRDIEGRSALLLGKAKDNNASCAIGPMLRLFDGRFGMNEVRALELSLTVTGAHDGFVLRGRSSMREISRDPEALVAQAMGRHHQYPDGIMLFLGTMFAPTEDRPSPDGSEAGQGFTHRDGDRVEISTPVLGCLTNVVGDAEAAPPWNFGIRSLMRNLAARGLIEPAREQ